MRQRINLQKLTELKEQYLCQRHAEKRDLEIISRLERGESAVLLSQEYHLSVSSVYRLRQRVADFLEDPSGSPDEDDDYYIRLLENDISTPLPFISCLSMRDNYVSRIFLLSMAIYLTGHRMYLPRWVLARVSPRLGRKDYATFVIRQLQSLTLETGLLFTFPVYESLSYNKGILFSFSKYTESILDSYRPAVSLIIRDPEE